MKITWYQTTFNIKFVSKTGVPNKKGIISRKEVKVVLMKLKVFRYRTWVEIVRKNWDLPYKIVDQLVNLLWEVQLF